MFERVGGVLAVGFAAALVAFGCGTSGDSSSSTASPAAATVTVRSDLTKAELIKRADAICKRTDEAQRAGLAAYTEKNPNAQSNEADLVKAVERVGLPPLQDEVEELAALGAPSGDEKEIRAIIVGIEKGIEKGRDDPSLLLSVSKSPFAEVDKLADKYGFKVCNTAF